MSSLEPTHPSITPPLQRLFLPRWFALVQERPRRGWIRVDWKKPPPATTGVHTSRAPPPPGPHAGRPGWGSGLSIARRPAPTAWSLRGLGPAGGQRSPVCLRWSARFPEAPRRQPARPGDSGKRQGQSALAVGPGRLRQPLGADHPPGSTAAWAVPASRSACGVERTLRIPSARPFFARVPPRQGPGKLPESVSPRGRELFP